MAKKPDTGARAPLSAAPQDGPDFEQVAEAGQRSLAALAHLHTRAFRDALKFNAELLDFARRRITADINTSDRLARCVSVNEAMDVISDYYQGAFRDYAEETTALVRLGTAIGSESAAEAISEATQLNRKKGG
jgi:hypothetical protein